MSWSSGKDSAWALQALLNNADVEVVGLFSTLNAEYDRVAMHGVRRELLEQQASRIGLPLEIIEIPNPCPNDEYEHLMSAFVEDVKRREIDCFAFGDLFLEDVRRYRERNLEGTGITPLFPIWGLNTKSLSRQMVKAGIKTVLTCVDTEQLPGEYAGRYYDGALLDNLPEKVDPCGENGEFHSFVFDAPFFDSPIDIEVGEVIQRGQFVFADVRPV